MLSANTHMPVVQRSAGSHACPSVTSSVYLLHTACVDADDRVTANRYYLLSLAAVTGSCHCLLSLPAVTVTVAVCTQAHRLADTFEKRVEELHKRVQEGMETGKLGIKEASRLVVELQDVSGCVRAGTHMYILCVCKIHTYCTLLYAHTYLRTYSPYVSCNLHT